MRAEDYESVDIAHLPVVQKILLEKNFEAKRASLVARPGEDKKVVSEVFMAKIDSLTPEIRVLVHEFGWGAVRKRLGMSARAMRISIEQERHDWYERQAAADRAAAVDSIELEL